MEENRPWGRILAGGTDILPKTRAARHNKSLPLVLIDIKRIDDLRGIREENGWLVIGPATTLSELAASCPVRSRAPVLALAAGQVGSPEIRNRGTVGGNLGSKNTGADLLVPLAGLGAVVEVCDSAGPGELPLQELLSTAWQDLGRRLVLTAVKVPLARPAAWGYRRWARESMGRSWVSALAGLEPQGDAKNYRFTAVLGGAGLWPRVLENIVPAEDLFDPEARLALAGRAAEEILSASGRQRDDYRCQVARAGLSEALELAGRGVRP